MRAIRLSRDVGVDGAARQLKCGRSALYEWLAAFEAEGSVGLLEGSRRPHRLRPSIPAWVDQVIITIRLLTYWNSKRIAAEMRRRQIYRVGHRYIDDLLRLEGCARGSVPPRPGPRYERTSPNELWHIDIKDPFFINLGPRQYIKTWLVGLVDDHSRFVIGLRILTQAAATPILAWLDECFELCGRPLELMSDNGQPFVVWMPYVLTRFGKRLRDLHIQHLRTQISSPWTQWQNRGLLGRPAGRSLGSSALCQPGGRRSRAGPVRSVLQLPPAQWRARLGHAGGALRRHGLHRPRLRAHPRPNSSPALAPSRHECGLNLSAMYGGTSPRR
jgi:integrase-like protein